MADILSAPQRCKEDKGLTGRLSGAQISPIRLSRADPRSISNLLREVASWLKQHNPAELGTYYSIQWQRGEVR